ncbi:hypothetical protein D5086_007306 [Populus alba]|uniref:Uncharacterized protein n=1 Tax=Populus alba TaxID=43335 RepID=A0ACC4CQ87_POPAL
MEKLNFVKNGAVRLPPGFRLVIMHRQLATKVEVGSVAVPMENWVLCRIFLKKRSTKNEEENMQFGNDNRLSKLRTTKPVFYDFMTKHRTTDLNLAPSSSSGSSGITEVSCNESDDHEESSSCNSFPYFRRKP